MPKGKGKGKGKAKGKGKGPSKPNTKGQEAAEALEKLTIELEDTSPAKFAAFKTELAEYEELLASGDDGLTAIRTKDEEKFGSCTDEDLMSVIEGMRFVNSASEHIDVGCKYEGEPQMFAAPEDTKGGDTVAMTLPDGEQMTFQLPEGCKPGDPLKMDIFTVPEGVKGGESVEMAVANGGMFAFALPDDAKPGQKIRVVVPVSSKRECNIVIPEGSTPGEEVVAALGDGSAFKFRVPRNAEAGQTARVTLPNAIDDEPRNLTVVILEGMEPGMTIAVNLPDSAGSIAAGETFDFTVPEGAKLDDEFGITVIIRRPENSSVNVEIPEGAEPGTMLTVSLPHGEDIEWKVPPDGKVGDTFDVSFALDDDPNGKIFGTFVSSPRPIKAKKPKATKKKKGKSPKPNFAVEPVW